MQKLSVVRGMNYRFSQPLESSRLTLRRLRPQDAAAVFGYRSLPEVARYQYWDFFKLEDAKYLIQEQALMEPARPGTWFQLAIEETATGLVIGDCGLHCRLEDPRQMEIGMTLAPSHQGRGYATEALQCLLEFIFVPLDMHRVSAVMDVENVRSAALFRRVGFRQEGHLIEHLWYKGRWSSEYLFALLKTEWQAQRAGDPRSHG